jgi:hypothetical protein
MICATHWIGKYILGWEYMRNKFLIFTNLQILEHSYQDTFASALVPQALPCLVRIQLHV